VKAKEAVVFTNPAQEQIDKLLRTARVIAMVGLSADPARPSHRVARDLQGYGYRVIPVTPAQPSILGEAAVPTLAELPGVLKPGEQVDIVDVFRKSQFVAGIVDECIRLKLPALWLQEGVIDPAAAERAVQVGIFTVMDHCIYKARAALP
jgi:predicted CoA-binding protein